MGCGVGLVGTTVGAGVGAPHAIIPAERVICMVDTAQSAGGRAPVSELPCRSRIVNCVNDPIENGNII